MKVPVPASNQTDAAPLVSRYPDAGFVLVGEPPLDPKTVSVVIV
jgi:hypothetical protein